MGTNSNYYDLLGLPSDATPDELRHAYREAAMRHHPDVNPDRDAHERFLLVQDAYRVLSDASARQAYDRELADADPAAVLVEILYSVPAAALINEEQLIYALLNISPRRQPKASFNPALNVCLVIDRSTSMQGARMDSVKEAAVGLVRRMRPQDRMSIVTFSDQAEIIAPAGKTMDHRSTENLIQMIRPGGGTEIFQGLKAGLDEVLSAASATKINQILLITDGRTFGDEDQCLQLAESAARQGISISALGIGADWNDVFIDRLTSLTGGGSFFISQADFLQRMLQEQVDQFKETFADRTVLKLASPPGVELLSVYRTAPLPATIPVDGAIHLGAVPIHGSLSVILEYRVAAPSTDSLRITLAAGELLYDLPGEMHKHQESRAIHLSRLTRRSVTAALPPPQIFHALAQLNLYRMQERARYEVSIGKMQEAGRRLQRLATELLNRGETELAHTAVVEAERIQHTQMLSAQGEKQIKYGTRSLWLKSGGQNAEKL